MLKIGYTVNRVAVQNDLNWFNAACVPLPLRISRYMLGVYIFVDMYLRVKHVLND